MVAEDANTKIYKDYAGDEYLVDKANPYILVDDVNDANLMKATTGFTFLRGTNSN